MSTLPSTSTDPPPQEPTRKFPAPCWTQQETVSLINAYRDKWYSLRRRNLRSVDWDAVSTAVAAKCPGQTPSKSSAQCRHKMEKLRKRYRTEKQRSLSFPNRFFSSSWIFFDLMDALETGSSLCGGLEQDPTAQKGNSSKFGSLEERENQFCKTNEGLKGKNSSVNRDSEVDVLAGGSFGKIPHLPVKLFKFKNYGSSLDCDSNMADHDDDDDGGDELCGRTGFRVETPYDGYGGHDSKSFHGKTSKINGNFGPGFLNKTGGVAAKRGLMDSAAVMEMVAAIKTVADEFVKMEKRKIDMVREIEEMKMEMEMKRSRMILDSQQLIVNAFVDGFLGKKRQQKAAAAAAAAAAVADAELEE
ncbi:hypothetical protein Nepgr_031623 [Nepenthes gracilis]|uniref:Myb/SANT-like DNA-binding domain-containing protein n=1 Tax=Nepenthes gracilis TaxID=150966 RepID=A0AAD3TH29_NEPGR|nr:hypothetical protein Nepgr_031623 [Nepenthes gracilis]